MTQRSQKAPPPNKLKNRYSGSTHTFDAIEHELARHGAKSISFDYDGEGRRSAITFAMVIQGHRQSFHLPARTSNVEKILAKQNGWTEMTEARRQQAFRTAWANIRDWIASQMALVDAEMVQAEEVFLPFLVTPGGQTLFFAMQERQFLLPSPKQKAEYTVSEVEG